MAVPTRAAVRAKPTVIALDPERWPDALKLDHDALVIGGLVLRW